MNDRSIKRHFLFLLLKARQDSGKDNKTGHLFFRECLERQKKKKKFEMKFVGGREEEKYKKTSRYKQGIRAC